MFLHQPSTEYLSELRQDAQPPCLRFLIYKMEVLVELNLKSGFNKLTICITSPAAPGI